MKRLTWTIFCVLLAACTPAMSPHAAMDRTNSEFAGRDVNDFFLSYGSPAGKQATPDGMVYRWLSIEPGGGHRPASVITYPGGHFGDIGDNANGETISGYCEISIRTDAQDRIRKLTLIYDSIGKYTGSRCSEIFGAPPP